MNPAFSPQRPFSPFVPDMLRLSSLAFAALLSCAAAAAPPPLLLAPVDQPTKASQVFAEELGLTAEAFQATRFNAGDALAMRAGDEALLSLPDNLTYRVTFERLEHHPSGNTSWVGHLTDFGTSYRVVFTQGANAAFGQVRSPAGEFRIESDAKGQWLIDVRKTGLRDASDRAKRGDFLLAPPGPRAPQHLQEARAKAGGPPSTVDVMIVYTPNMVTRLGSVANVQARFDQLIALSNQAYLDSQISLTLRLVHMEQVGYTETNDNDDALFELTGSNGSSSVSIPPSLSGVAGLRNTYGADLVILARSYKTATMDSCGIAWLSVSRSGSTIYSNPAFGYGVIADGWDGVWGCGNFTFTHEVGHLFGAAHDRVTENQPTGADPNLVYSYAYGYGVVSTLYTIMAYGSSFGSAAQYAVFSNPNINCAGQPCGKAVGQPDEAYNALALDNTRELIAAYRGTASFVQRAFVSAKIGSDANLAQNCPANAPCRWFSAAVGIVAPGGEVVAMDSGAYGAVSLAKSVSLVAAPGAYAGISVFGGAGVTIATPGLSVVLRGLTINGMGGSHGIVMTAGTKLSVENCVVANFAGGYGLSVTGSSNVRVLSSLFRDNAYGINLSNGASASISRTRLLGNGQGVYATSDTTGLATKAMIHDAVVAMNGYGIVSRAVASGSSSTVSVRRSVVTQNSSAGLRIVSSSGGAAVLESVGGNTVRQNATNVDGSLSTVAPI